jgi:putative RecB family exonuclease
MISRPHWSYSSINQFLRCPLQFYFERILRLPQRTVGSGLVLGSAVHRTLEAYHRGLQEKQPRPLDHLQTVFLSAWKTREEKVEITYRNGDSRDHSVAQGIDLIEVYLQEPPPESIVAVEQEMVVPLHNSKGDYLERPLVAVLDLITHEEGLKVSEFKTSGRAYGEFEAETSIQPTCYLNAVQEMYGEPAAVEFVVLVKTKKPKVQRIPVVRDDGDVARLGDLIQAIERAIEAKAFFPIETPMNCSNCPHREPCREWGRSSDGAGLPSVNELVGTPSC